MGLSPVVLHRHRRPLPWSISTLSVVEVFLLSPQCRVIPQSLPPLPKRQGAGHLQGERKACTQLLLLFWERAVAMLFL